MFALPAEPPVLPIASGTTLPPEGEEPHATAKTASAIAVLEERSWRRVNELPVQTGVNMNERPFRTN